MSILATDPFLSCCRISRAGFIGVLLERPANPACLAERDPGEYWDECRAWGVDPCFLLAMFTHESSMGTAGTAIETRSWGNTRSPSFGAVQVGEVAGRSGVFPQFAAWLDGCASTAGRLASPVWPAGAPYGERTCIREIFDHPSGQVWAPAGDMNDPAGYLNAMLALMNDYADQDDEVIPGPFRAPAPAVYSHYLTINHSSGRGGAPVAAIILHVTAGASAESCLNWFANPASQVSSHYVIDRDGTIFCTVRERDTAWANGVLNRPNTEIPVVLRWATEGINPNSETISIECAGFSSQQPSGDPALDGYSEAQFASLAFLLPALGDRHDLLLDAEDLFGHCEIDGVNRADCPGLSAAEWARVYSLHPTQPSGPYATPNEAFDAYLAENGETAVWAGQITGRTHWFGRDPQELCRTDAACLLAYDGGFAREAVGFALDEWQEWAKGVGLTIWGEPPPEQPAPEPGPVGAAWPLHPGDGVVGLPATVIFSWGRDASSADMGVYSLVTSERHFGVDGAAFTEVGVELPPGDYEWCVRGREGARVSDWSFARFAVAEPEPEEPPDPDEPDEPDGPSAPYKPCVAPTFAEQPAAYVWRNVHDDKVDLAVSRKWRPDCDGGTGPWPDTDQYVNPDFPNADHLRAPVELRKLVRRLSIHPPVVEAAYRQGLWERVPATYTVDGSEWEDDAATDYGDDWDDLPPHAQRWAQQICTLATAIQRAPTLFDAVVALGFSAPEADAWTRRYHCLRRRVHDLEELDAC